MTYQRVYLVEGDDNIYLDVYVSDPLPGYTRKGLLVIPGGGYSQVCSDREGEPIAQAFIPYGYNTFVLHYSVARRKIYPSQLIEASLAMKYIRDHAEEFHTNPDAVFAVGFSAGGHLCGSLATMWHRPEVYDAISMPFGYNKPTGAMLIYAVISKHDGTFHNLLGKDEPSEEELANVRIDYAVDEKTCPIFMAHTSNDQVVPIENALNMSFALNRAGAQFELHVYPNGPHGTALGNAITAHNNPLNDQPVIAGWVSAAAAWAEEILKKK